MKRRNFVKNTGIVALSAAAPAQVFAQSGFSYEDAITVSGKLNRPGNRKIKVAFAINPGVQVIDLAGPWEVFQDVYFTEEDEGMTPGSAFELYTVSESTEPLQATGGLTIVPKFSVQDAPDPDLLVIPHFATMEMTPIHEWITKANESTELTMSICTGAFQLAKTGLLDGLEATTNQLFYDRFEGRFPQIELHRGPRFVEVPGFATSGGLTAGIDLSLRVVDRLFDRKVAQKTADELEYTGTGWKV